MEIGPITPEDLPELYAMTKEEDPLLDQMSPWSYTLLMTQRPGWTVRDKEGELAAAVCMSDISNIDCVLHVVCKSKYRGRWVSRKVLRTVFGHVFNTMRLPRCSGFCVKGLTDIGGEFLAGIGFKSEGVKRKSFALSNGERYDLELYGMLKEECRWL